MHRIHPLSAAIVATLSLNAVADHALAESRSQPSLIPAPLPAGQSGSAFEVNALGDAGNGVCGMNVGECTLRDALNAANSDPDHTTVTFSPTVFTGVQSIELTMGELPVLHATTITGPGMSALTIDAQSNSRVFNAPDYAGLPDQHTVSISDVTVTGGSATDHGGAIYSTANQS